MSAVEGLRECLLGTFDIHMGRVSQRANDVMKTLTLLSAIAAARRSSWPGSWA